MAVPVRLTYRHVPDSTASAASTDRTGRPRRYRAANGQAAPVRHARRRARPAGRGPRRRGAGAGGHRVPRRSRRGRGAARPGATGRAELGRPRPVPPHLAQGRRLRSRCGRLRGRALSRGRGAARHQVDVPGRGLPHRSGGRAAHRTGRHPAQHRAAGGGRVPGRAARPGAASPRHRVGVRALGGAVRVVARAAVAAAGQPGRHRPGRRRRRSGSVLASAGLHWAANGLGVLASSVLWAAKAA
ncbi:hypothetical protein B0I33_112232 [Prauserella shujinwangii]|uniref:CAAX prenyl protease-like protein n=1 Tax=Prauserella shujinwangii TaxID=1453103 RepID=A0A2T0LMQ4_9PSEU|nr:hypothetical protein B0I33_112232 [Prauserella shujinwangii]